MTSIFDGIFGGSEPVESDDTKPLLREDSKAQPVSEEAQKAIRDLLEICKK
jgi:hypothetical protein